jgi:hypothetical protein
MIGEIFDFLSNFLLLGLRGFLNVSNQRLQLSLDYHHFDSIAVLIERGATETGISFLA